MWYVFEIFSPFNNIYRVKWLQTQNTSLANSEHTCEKIF